jgi:hypothetical protein
MGPPSYMRSVVDRNVVMRLITVSARNVLSSAGWYFRTACPTPEVSSLLTCCIHLLPQPFICAKCLISFVVKEIVFCGFSQKIHLRCCDCVLLLFLSVLLPNSRVGTARVLCIFVVCYTLRHANCPDTNCYYYQTESNRNRQLIYGLTTVTDS